MSSGQSQAQTEKGELEFSLNPRRRILANEQRGAERQNGSVFSGKAKDETQKVPA
jgi:hypothetical protein